MPVFEWHFMKISTRSSITLFAIKKFKFFFLGEELKQMNDQKPNIITEKCSLLNDFELTFWRICMRSSSYSLRFRFLASENRNFGSKGHIDGCNDTINVFFFIEYMHTMRWQANVNKYDRSIDFTWVTSFRVIISACLDSTRYDRAHSVASSSDSSLEIRTVQLFHLMIVGY